MAGKGKGKSSIFTKFLKHNEARNAAVAKAGGAITPTKRLKTTATIKRKK